MSLHIAAQPGDIAETVLLPGDPLRAKVIAENFLENAVCHNEIRGMLGFTGTYKGKKISVQGTGMGIPSISIYVNELLMLGAKKLVRIGTCGSLQPHIELRDLVLAMSTSTDSATNRIRFSGRDFAPTASFHLLQKANEKAGQMGFRKHVGNVLSTDTFYDEDPDGWKLWANYGVLAVEMEAAGLYTLAAKHGVEALAIMTVSDSLVTGGKISPADRQTAFMDMVRLALETVS